ncbi:MmpS family transport accessory protein [Streptomyces sp. LE64]|uniref:MmpS family transport accessory protein n=1 Tax=unclassified Streptomyces TaxID=2593676 RepID=UPI00331B63DE
MRRSIRSTALAAVTVAGLTFGLTACSEATEAVKDKAVEEVDKKVNEEYEVTYEITGESVDSITYASGGGTATEPKLTTEDKPTLPWKKTVTLRGIMPPSVVPVAVDAGAASVSCKIVYKGKTIAEESGEGVATATGCTAVSPIV